MSKIEITYFLIPVFLVCLIFSFVFYLVFKLPESKKIINNIDGSVNGKQSFQEREKTPTPKVELGSRSVKRNAQLNKLENRNKAKEKIIPPADNNEEIVLKEIAEGISSDLKREQLFLEELSKENIDQQVPINYISLDELSSFYDEQSKSDDLFVLTEDGSSFDNIVVSELVEDSNKIKHIGYEPNHMFDQIILRNYPIVKMPRTGCVIKFPRKGRTLRKGFSEDYFNNYLVKYFSHEFQIYNDRHITLFDSSVRYEPDFTLIKESNGKNIFINIEIDEPYEGTNDIENRKITHVIGTTLKRDFEFTKRGWIVIRFSEQQIVTQTLSCLLFIADILKLIDPTCSIPDFFENVDEIKHEPCWTQSVAQYWSRNKFREYYLGISKFGFTESNTIFLETEPSQLELEIEENVKDELFIEIKPTEQTEDNLSKKISHAIENNLNIRMELEELKFLLKPEKIISNYLVQAYCYISNEVKIFELVEGSLIFCFEDYASTRITRSDLNFKKIASIVKIAIQNKKYLRIEYTKSNYLSENVNLKSIRTINQVNSATAVLDTDHINRYNLNEHHITAFCNLRKEQRTFNIFRINKLEVLRI